MQFFKTFVTAALVVAAEAHMKLDFPAPFRGVNNQNVPDGSKDYSMTAPLKGDGSDFPCKGYQTDLGTPAGASVVTWAAGSSANFSVSGGAFHNGGSCQASLSFDKGASFTVIHSYIGNCPTASGGSFDFTVPSDAPTGEAIFAWSWLNQIGNREYYMNCAAVTIGKAASKKRDASISYSSRPGLFVANLNNGCTDIESTDVVFPDPGPDVTDTSQKHGGLVGTCTAVKGVGGSSGSSGSASSAVSPLASSATSVQASLATSASVTPSPGVFFTSSVSASQAPSGFQTSYTPAARTSSPVAAASAAPTSSSTGNSTISADGSCTGTFTCKGSTSGPCCSSFGWCGVTPAHCNLSNGCNPLKGSCGLNSTSPSSSAASSPDLSNLSTAATTFSTAPSVKTATVMETMTVTVTDQPSGQLTVIPVSSSSSASASGY